MFIGLLVLLLVVLVLLAVPLELDFRLVWPEGEYNQVMFVWAFGLIRLHMPVGGSMPALRGRDEAPEDSDDVRRNKSRNILAPFKQWSFRHRIYRLVGDLWRAIRKEDVRLRARIGVGDPAGTGQLWGVVGPISSLLGGLKEASLVIEPDFFDATFEIDGSGRLRLVPLKVLTISMGLLVSPAIWRGLSAMERS